MEAWFLATGAMHWLKLFEAQMQAQPFYLSATGADGKQTQIPMFGILEPVQLYRFIFPKEAAGISLKTLGFDNPTRKDLKAQVWAIKKSLGLKDYEGVIPDVTLPVKRDNIFIQPIGIREDVEGVFTENGVKQEKL